MEFCIGGEKNHCMGERLKKMSTTFNESCSTSILL